jgi:hypothetical protein
MTIRKDSTSSCTLMKNLLNNNNKKRKEIWQDNSVIIKKPLTTYVLHNVTEMYKIIINKRVEPWTMSQIGVDVSLSQS